MPGAWPEDVSLQQNSEKHPDLSLRTVGPPTFFGFSKNPDGQTGPLRLKIGKLELDAEFFLDHPVH